MVFISSFSPPKLKHADSISSIGSMTALSRPSRGDYDITGDVQLAIEYKKKELLIHVKRARGLASSNAGSTFPDAYIKIYLLPDKSKHSKRKTDVKRKTANPVYKEILKVCGTTTVSCTIGCVFHMCTCEFVSTALAVLLA